LRTLRDNLHQQLCSLLIRDSNAGASIFVKKNSRKERKDAKSVRI